MKISVITVVYNGEETIERTINSVINQKNVEVEYIIVDGKSTDHTLDVVRKYERYIAHIISEPDNGIYDAMNKGSRLASGDIISFLNSDDWYEEDVLQHIIRQFEDFQIDVLCADARMLYKLGSRIRVAETEKRIILKQLPASHQAIFTTRKWFKYIGEFCTRYTVSADYEWITRSLVQNCKIKLLHVTVVNFMSGGFSAKNSELSYKEIKEIAFHYYMGTSLETDMKRYYAYMDFMRTGNEEEWEKLGYPDNAPQVNIPTTKSIYIFGTGKAGTECFKLLQKLGYLVAGFIDNYASEGQSTYRGKPIKKFENVLLENDYYIIIASINYEEDMRKQVEKEGLCDKRDFCLYSRLREHIIFD